jgi:hypothetical protein
MTRFLIAAVAAGCALPAVARPAKLGTREIRPDGMELLVLPVPSARTASLRYVIRVGSACDPAGKEGLAHLLEHLVLKARGPDGLDVVEAAHAAGAYLNAFTSRDATTFVLDAPLQVFPALAERVVRAITSPALHGVNVERELAVIAREDEYHGERSGALTLVNDAVFRVSAIEGTTLGSVGSRERISREDLIAFFQARYLTTATTVVVAGGVGVPEVRALLDGAVLLPPSLETERPRAVVLDPQLPVNERIRAPFLAVVFGYALEAGDHHACGSLAALVEHRLVVELTADQPVLRSVNVGCVTLRGANFVLAMGHTPTIEATDLPDTIRRVFQRTARQLPTTLERRLLEQRLSRIADRVRADPAALANEVADRAERPRENGLTPLPEEGTRPFPAEVVRALAQRAFVPERRVLILLSPFEG